MNPFNMWPTFVALNAQYLMLLPTFLHQGKEEKWKISQKFSFWHVLQPCQVSYQASYF